MRPISHIYKSPNFDEREGAIDMIVIHTMTKPELESIEQLCDPESKVSAHYVISQNGEIYSLVDEEKRAWHAGESFWRGRERINNHAIGIELINMDHLGRAHGFPPKQMESLIELCLDIINRRNIPAYNVIGHSDIAPGRKEDPGEYFNWQMLAKHNIGIYHNLEDEDLGKVLASIGEEGEAIRIIQELLLGLGYKINLNGKFDEEMAKVIIAFKRHFCQKDLLPNFCSRHLDILSHLQTKANKES